jgi:hypothetical protein
MENDEVGTMNDERKKESTAVFTSSFIVSILPVSSFLLLTISNTPTFPPPPRLAAKLDARPPRVVY